MRQWTGLSILFTILLCLFSFLPVQAQQNLLQNPGFEGEYTGQQGRGDFTFPAGWEGWFTESPHDQYWMNVVPTGYPHHGPFRQAGDSSLSIAKGSGSFTAAVLQRVGNIPAGAVLRGTAYVYMENNEGTNAQVRIGIGSNIGNNVTGAVTWSEWEKRVRGMHQISVEHVATGGEVTLIVYTTQTWPNDPNAVYVDEASLVIVGQSDVAAEGSDKKDSDKDKNKEPVIPSIPNSVPFVSVQKARAGETITHVVGSGDTLASIAVAYNVPIDEIAALNGIERKSLLQLGQVLTIATPDPNQPAPTVEPTVEPTIEAPVATEEVAAPIIPTDTPPDNPPSDSPGEAQLSASLINQHSSTVNLNRIDGNSFNMTFTDNHLRVAQVMPRFIGDSLPLNFWTQFWDMNPGITIQDAILIVDEFTVNLSLSGLQFNASDNSISYTGVITAVTNAQGQVVDITTIPPEVLLNNPDVYFQADSTVFNALSMASKTTSLELGQGFLCTWLGC